MLSATRPQKKRAGQSSTVRSSANNRLLPSSTDKKPSTRKKSANSNGKKKKKPSGRKFGRKLVKNLLHLGVVAGIWGGIIIAVLATYYSLTLPDISKLGIIEKRPSITILNEKDQVLATSGDLYGEFIPYDELPSNLVNAVLATEDRRFFDHMGVDFFGLARAFYTNIRGGRVMQGGSTITQQLAKIVFLTPERTIERKLKEMILAFWLERRFTKEEILAIYLNRVYLGSGNYGVAAAARYYFGKDVRNVNLSEAAILAGLLKAPSRYSPAAYPDRAKDRAQQVLFNMADAGYISENQAQQEPKLRPASLEKGVKKSLANPYFADWVLEQIPDYVGTTTSDLTVKTTLDIKLQSLAEKNLAAVLNANPNLNASQGALITLSPEGKILAMVGGKNYAESQFNRAVKAQRQPGSAFKLFVYLTALEYGYQPYSIVNDSAVRIKKWMPANYEGNYQGEMSLIQAFAKSVNTVAVKLSEESGRENVIAMAKRLGIASPIEPNPSLALGASEVNLLELTQAYAHLANNGMSVVPYSIIEIRDNEGHLIYRRAPEKPTRVLDRQTVADMNLLLTEVIQTGTGRGANIGRPAAGKTGTSQDFHDAWFIGFTPDLITGVWVGNDDNSAMNHVTGGKLPAQIWRGFMSAALAGKPARPIPVDAYGPGRGVLRSIGEDFDSMWNSIMNTFGGGSGSGGSHTPDVEYTYPNQRR